MTASAAPSLAALAENYDAFIFDLWGVLHDGTALFPAVLPVLQALRGQGKGIGVLSNSPRPVRQAATNIAAKFGLEPNRYDTLLTSGQLAFEALRDRPDAWMRRLGTRVFPVGPPHEIEPFLELGLQPVATVPAAEFVLCTGLLPGLEQAEDYLPLLTAWKQRRLPMLCANPDREVLRGAVHGIAAGAIAEAYRDQGGDVRDDCGKPYHAVFRRMLAALGTAPHRSLMIGDNLHTDIAGAAALGIGTLWITSGVHGADLAVADPKAFAARHGQRFDHWMQELRW